MKLSGTIEQTTRTTFLKREGEIVMLALHTWQNFYILVGTVSATLIGLLFVALSIGSSIPVQRAKEYTRTFVTPILFIYGEVLFVSCLALMPLDSMFPLGGLLVALGTLNLFFTGKLLWRLRVIHRDDTELDRDHWLWYTLLPGVISLVLIASAFGFFFGAPLTVLVLAVIVLLVLALGLRNTWNLMLWLIMHRGASHAESESFKHKESKE